MLSGEKSTYTTVVGGGRKACSAPYYMDKNGNSMLDNHHEVVIHPNASFAGTGHNAEIMTDKRRRLDFISCLYPG